MDLDNYQLFIQQLSTFKWCVSCGNKHPEKCFKQCLLAFFSFSCIIGNTFNNTQSQIISLK